MTRTSGMTLIEVVVVLLLLGVVLGIAGVSFPRQSEPSPQMLLARELMAARDLAIMSGELQRVLSGEQVFLFAPDGSVSGTSGAVAMGLAIDPLTGEVRVGSR